MENLQMNVEDRLFLDSFNTDDRSHLKVKDTGVCLKCKLKQCSYTCPAKCYTIQDGKAVVAYEGCLECGTCRIVCNEFFNIDWKYPRGGFGISLKFG